MLEWKRSSKCEQGACVEVACYGGECPEVTIENEMVGVRNSKIPGEMVWFTFDEWHAFVEGVKAGEFSI